ncbi:TIM barrel protein [Streptosporangiaceae bacterium NEAU-GS5]|nr:TIM barrel protein [Streptosporangiaceae bacterium NEAU-GS5]
MKIAGAPISWGVCEVPGWGPQLSRDRVLREMRDLGLTATELGPEGFIPDPALPGDYGLTVIGAFVPVVLHDPDVTPEIPELPDGTVTVLAAATGRDGYDEKPVLDAVGWATLLRNLDRIAAEAVRTGGLVTLHPHVGTMVETRSEVWRVLDGSATPLCLDTGHLLIGGTDPREIPPGRVAHAHLKDVDAGLAEQVGAGRLTYTDAVGKGIYRPLGEGDADIAGVVRGLSSYDGWYVMEQDVILTSERDDPAADVRASLAYLEALT